MRAAHAWGRCWGCWMRRATKGLRSIPLWSGCCERRTGGGMQCRSGNAVDRAQRTRRKRARKCSIQATIDLCKGNTVPPSWCPQPPTAAAQIDLQSHLTESCKYELPTLIDGFEWTRRPTPYRKDILRSRRSDTAWSATGMSGSQNQPCLSKRAGPCPLSG